MYNTDGIINYGEDILKKNEKKLDSIILFANKLATDSFAMYQIQTSNTTDLFMFSEFNYNKTNKEVEEGDFVEITNTDKENVWRVLPQKDITSFNFVKNLYVSFDLKKCRSRNDKDAKLLYCYDKDKLLKVFPNFKFYENNQIVNISDTSKWIYFYNKCWAITTNSTFYEMSKQDCKRILK